MIYGLLGSASSIKNYRGRGGQGEPACTTSISYSAKVCSFLICWFHGGSFKGFSIVFLLPDWLKLNHLKSRMECDFSDILSRHFCSTVAETIGLTNYAARFGAKKCSENHIWSCWDDSRSMEPTICFAKPLEKHNTTLIHPWKSNVSNLKVSSSNRTKVCFKSFVT